MSNFAAINLSVLDNDYSVFVIQAVIIGTTFVRMTDATTGYFSRGGVLFLWGFISSLGTKIDGHF